MASTQARTTGILLVNLGTPEGTPSAGPSVEQVRTYLRQFLMDRYVVDIPWLMRWILVNGIILPKRPALSAEAYRKIWTERGSPLLTYHLDLTEGVRQQLESDFVVEPAMRYGNPSIPSAMSRMKDAGVHDILVVPLYPQYSLAATESTVEECRVWVEKNRKADGSKIGLEFFPAFYRDPQFIEAFARVAEEHLHAYDHEHLLFSFHGLPERHVRKTDATGAHCLAGAGCCEEMVVANQDCYRAQCYATARALARRLGLSEDRYSVCFQSRLGRTPWIRPYTDVVYQELAARGVKRVAVMCPAFVADCLETLEEIRIRGHEEFCRLGGEGLRLIPSLNAEPVWVDALSQMVRDHLKRGQLKNSQVQRSVSP